MEAQLTLTKLDPLCQLVVLLIDIVSPLADLVEPI